MPFLFVAEHSSTVRVLGLPHLLLCGGALGLSQSLAGVTCAAAVVNFVTRQRSYFFIPSCSSQLFLFCCEGASLSSLDGVSVDEGNLSSLGNHPGYGALSGSEAFRAELVSGISVLVKRTEESCGPPCDYNTKWVHFAARVTSFPQGSVCRPL